jgi:glyoxylase-like metal-dependent hydrolase (beta-lactamase superfamily II)
VRHAATAFVGLALFAGVAVAQSVPPAPPQDSPGGLWPARQAPGFYRFELGDVEVVALLDGTHPFPATELAVGAKPGEVVDLLAKEALASPTEGGFSAYLVRLPGHTVLIDTGAGDLYGRDGGLLLANMRAAGTKPEQIDEIYLTHLHRDHVGGLLSRSRPVFPRAIVRASRVEADFWLSDANRTKVPSFLGTMFDGAQQSLRAYIASGRFKPFDNGAALAPGIRPIAAPGHTPGHRQYLVESRGKALLIWGDIVHVAPVQLPDPHVAMRYDTDPTAAIASRETALAEAADKGWWVAGAHVSFPGIGRIRRTGPGTYAWVPVPYSLNRMPQP